MTADLKVANIKDKPQHYEAYKKLIFIAPSRQPVVYEKLIEALAERYENYDSKNDKNTLRGYDERGVWIGDGDAFKQQHHWDEYHGYFSGAEPGNGEIPLKFWSISACTDSRRLQWLTMHGGSNPIGHICI